MNTSDYIQIALTLSLVAITAYYAWQTRKTVHVMEEANEENNRPVVSISLRERNESISFIDFIITNAGKGLARNITFKVKGNNFLIKEIAGKKEYLKDFRIIKNGIQVLAPNEKRKYWFLSLMGRVDEMHKYKTNVEIAYTNNKRTKLYKDTFDLDFLSLPEYSLGNEPVYKISKELEKISKELERIRREIKK
jgi:hypothetical protein